MKPFRKARTMNEMVEIKRISNEFKFLIVKCAYTVCCPVSGRYQYPDTSTKTQFLRRRFQLSVNKVFRMKAEHFGFKMKVLAR